MVIKEILVAKNLSIAKVHSEFNHPNVKSHFGTTTGYQRIGKITNLSIANFNSDID